MIAMTKLELLNRQQFEAQLEALSSEQCSLAVLDIDHFKEINDSLGHDIGDEVLRNLEYVLATNLPVDALLARMGGDEYAVALPDMPAENALIVLEEIRSHFSSRPPSDKMQQKVQVSAGIATKPTHASQLQDLLRAADEALYRAKTEGRGRIAIYVESKMTLKSNYYSKAALEKLSKLSSALDRTEASLLREALDDLFIKYGDAL